MFFFFSRLSRQKSTDGSNPQLGGTPSSRTGSTKSLDSSANESSSPQNWERHYGCWKNHFRHRQGTNSTPPSPILYRASSSKSYRSDSMLSISSMSSVTSLPGHVALEKETSSCISALDRNPHLTTQSCPNSPRRVPKKLAAQQGISQAEICNRLRSRDAKASAAISNAPSTSSLSVSTSNCSSSPATASVVISSGATATGGTAASHQGSAWGTPPVTSPCHRFMSHNNTASSSTVARNTVKISSGITRWVMKRSAYKYAFDKS